MQSYLIIYHSTKFRNNWIANLVKTQAIPEINVLRINPTGNLGIDEVRILKSRMAQKAYGGGKRLVIIDALDKAKSEASNSLLKIVEEPPADTYIILTSNNLHTLLETIISRCQLIIEPENTDVLKAADYEKISLFMSDLLNKSIGERMVRWSKEVKTKDDALKLLDLLAVFWDRELTKEKSLLPRKKIAQILKKILSARSYLLGNVNYKATLDILFIGFPRME